MMEKINKFFFSHHIISVMKKKKKNKIEMSMTLPEANFHKFIEVER
jgi:hypothetical protein